MQSTRFICSLLFIASASAGVAQQAAPRSISRAAKAEASAPSQLPVTRVALYKNGVGFFEHAGRVTGDQSVTIDFTTAQLNDVLQSLTAIDLNGGRIAGAGYNSTTPLEQQLKALPLGLGEEPTAIDFYNAIRGARVEVRSPGATITGRLLNIEVVNGASGEGKISTERRLVTVIGEGGEVRTVELTPATEVRLLDTELHTDVTRYLQLLASNRNQGLRHLTLQDNGTGTRELRVSYISEVPIWKSTYRILFSDTKAAKQTATVQGWSVVDNTTGEDWTKVQLSLIAGAPQSFIQPLSVPYYSRRPEIPLPQEAQLTPQTHESGDQSVVATTAAPATAAKAAPMSQRTIIGGPLGVVGRVNPGAGGLAQGVYGGTGQMNLSESYIEGMNFTELAENSFNANANTASFDDYFEYKLTEPITIRKNESAMVPILQTKVDAERVTLWSQRQPTPLRALWITNTSNLTLDRGSFSIVEDGNFGGEGLLDPIHPAERRLLSYAVDQAVRVTTESQHDTTRTTSITAAKGVLQVHQTQIVEVTYVVHNAAAEARMVVVEHPIRQNYTLDSDPKPEETTPTVYRYRVATGAGETVRLHVGERHANVTRYQLTNSNESQLAFIVSESRDSPAVKQALAPLLEARRKAAEMQSAVDQVNARLTALRADEERQRSNITALGTTDKASRERFVRDLNATEDQIAAAQKELTAAQVTLQAAKDDLAGKIEAVQIDEKL